MLTVPHPLVQVSKPGKYFQNKDRNVKFGLECLKDSHWPPSNELMFWGKTRSLHSTVESDTQKLSNTWADVLYLISIFCFYQLRPRNAAFHLRISLKISMHLHCFITWSSQPYEIIRIIIHCHSDKEMNSRDIRWLVWNYSLPLSRFNKIYFLKPNLYVLQSHTNFTCSIIYIYIIPYNIVSHYKK